MNTAVLAFGGLVALAVLAALVGARQLVQAAQSREQLVVRAEALGAAPEIVDDLQRRRSLLARLADRYDKSAFAAADRESLRKAFLPWSPSTYRLARIGIGIGSAGFFWYAFFHHPLPSTTLGFVIYLAVPWLLWSYRQDAYDKAFENQVPEVSQTIANGLRAGLSIRQALGRLPDRLDEPARGEFQRLNQSLALGDDLFKAFQALHGRMKSQDLKLLIDAIVIQHQAGGNLARLLTGIADILVAKGQLRCEANASAKSVRFTILLSAVTGLFLLTMFAGTSVMRPVLETPTGWAMIGGYIMLQIIIFVLANRFLLRFEV